MMNIAELAELFEKKTKAMQLINEIHSPLILEYYDFDSDKNLDRKIDILTQIKSGKKPDEIKGFWSILELYPDEEGVVI